MERNLRTRQQKKKSNEVAEETALFGKMKKFKLKKTKLKNSQPEDDSSVVESESQQTEETNNVTENQVETEMIIDQTSKNNETEKTAEVSENRSDVQVSSETSTLHEYWQFVRENPYDFNGWTTLLSHVETLVRIRIFTLLP